MADYSKFISPKRRSVPTPKNMVENGKCVFGTFDKEFETMNLLEIEEPTAAPDFLNRLRCTVWEAAEIHLDECVLLTACCDMGVFGQVLNIFYDKRKKKVHSWAAKIPSKKAIIAENLLNGSVTKAESKNFSVCFTNNFQDGRCHIKVRQDGKDAQLELEVTLSRISKPCVVSIPFDDPNVRHRPLYSQKDFFRCDGWVKFNGETFRTTETSTAIVDDHKGYYPRKSHYDWVTTMGINETNGEKKWFAFNLTRNQSINQEEYNENLIWLENETSLLPPVHFTQDVPSSEFKDKGNWYIRDEHDMVNVTFHIYDMYRMVVHAKPLVSIDYFVTFGELEGYVRDEDGNKYILDGMVGIGEDKTLLF